MHRDHRATLLLLLVPSALCCVLRSTAGHPVTHMHTMAFTNAMATILVLVSVCLASPAAAFVVGGGSLSANVAPSFATHVESNSVAHVSRRSRQRHVRRGVRGLNAAAEENEGGGAGFNPYSAFRSWQKDLVRCFLKMQSYRSTYITT